MKQKNIYTTFALFIFCSHTLFSFSHSDVQTCALTYTVNGGRLGDNITTFLKTKLISLRCSIPLLYTDFPYADHLQLSVQEKKITHTLRKTFLHTHTIKNDSSLAQNPRSNTLYICGYTTNVNNIVTLHDVYVYCTNNPDFKKIAQYLLTPRIVPEGLSVPEQHVSVAIHVRKGGGYDLPLLSDATNYNPRQKYADVYWPLKFPPEEYYAEQLKKLTTLFPDKKFFLCVFTDDNDPQALIKRLQKQYDHENFIWHYQPHQNQACAVIEDLYHMSKCSILIRSCSNFACAAEILGDHALIFFPAHATWNMNLKKPLLIVDQTEVIFNKGIV